MTPPPTELRHVRVDGSTVRIRDPLRRYGLLLAGGGLVALGLGQVVPASWGRAANDPPRLLDSGALVTDPAAYRVAGAVTAVVGAVVLWATLRRVMVLRPGGVELVGLRRHRTPWHDLLCVYRRTDKRWAWSPRRLLPESYIEHALVLEHGGTGHRVFTTLGSPDRLDATVDVIWGYRQAHAGAWPRNESATDPVRRRPVRAATTWAVVAIQTWAYVVQ